MVGSASASEQEARSNEVKPLMGTSNNGERSLNFHPPRGNFQRRKVFITLCRCREKRPTQFGREFSIGKCTALCNCERGWMKGRLQKISTKTSTIIKPASQRNVPTFRGLEDGCTTSCTSVRSSANAAKQIHLLFVSHQPSLYRVP